MNRFLGIVLSVLFVFGLVVVDYISAADLTTSGSIRFRGEATNNAGDFNDDRGDNKSAYDGRVRLAIDVKSSDKTTGRIHLESGSLNTDTYTWGQAGSDAEGTYGEGNGKRGTLDILEAWIQTKDVLGTPLGLKVGHMPLKVGNGLFFNHSKYGDDAIILFVDPTKELHVALINAKLTEGINLNANDAGGSAVANNNSDDTDAYVALFAYKGAGFNISGDVALLNDQNFVVSGTLNEGLQLWNVGLRADSKIAGIGLKSGVELQSGDSKNAAGTETKFKGYAVLIGADYTVSDVTLDAEMAVGSGDDDANDNKIKTFQTAQSDAQKFTYVYDYRVRTAGVNAPTVASASALGARNTGIANTTYYKIGASAKPTSDLSAKLDLYLLKATKAVSTSSTNSYNSKDIGTEIDGKLTCKIDKNLVYFVEGGYLWAGDFYKNITAGAVDPDKAYAVRHGVELTF